MRQKEAHVFGSFSYIVFSESEDGNVTTAITSLVLVQEWEGVFKKALLF
jgi:hypothetical protein